MTQPTKPSERLEPTEPAGEPIPILVDCDTGIDDSLALLYALASPECEVVAVTCTAGNVSAEQVAENTRAILELAGRADVEVALGRRRPLARALVTTPETHGPRGIGYAQLPAATAPLSARFSPDLIVSEARRRPGELTLVTLAPLTNVALAVLREPELPRLLKRTVIMGGSYRSNGNTAPTTEWNVSCDPEAAKVVFDGWEAAGVRPMALGLDVTERAKLLPSHLASLAARADCGPDGSRPDGTTNPIVRYLADALRFYMGFHSRYDHFYGALIHDPLGPGGRAGVLARPLRGRSRRRGARWPPHDRRNRDRLALRLGQAGQRRCRRLRRNRPLLTLFVGAARFPRGARLGERNATTIERGAGGNSAPPSPSPWPASDASQLAPTRRLRRPPTIIGVVDHAERDLTTMVLVDGRTIDSRATRDVDLLGGGLGPKSLVLARTSAPSLYTHEPNDSAA